MYAAEISRNNPAMILFLLDQSGSMQELFDPEDIQLATDTITKAQALADAINKLLQNLVIKCSKEDGIRDYFHIGVIGYGSQVGPALSGSLAGRDLVPISEVGATPARMEIRKKKVSDGAGGLVDVDLRFPIWFEATSSGGTPMCAGLQEAHRIAQDWINGHPNCFPPIVINISDGESTDGDPSNPGAALRGLASTDGPVLLFNLHLSGKKARAIEFPNSEAGLFDRYSKVLYQISSQLTPFMVNVANQQGFNASEGARGFVFNAKLEVAIQFLDIGTRASNLR